MLILNIGFSVFKVLEMWGTCKVDHVFLEFNFVIPGSSTRNLPPIHFGSFNPLGAEDNLKSSCVNLSTELILLKFTMFKKKPTVSDYFLPALPLLPAKGHNSPESKLTHNEPHVDQELISSAILGSKEDCRSNHQRLPDSCSFIHRAPTRCREHWPNPQCYSKCTATRECINCALHNNRRSRSTRSTGYHLCWCASR